MIRTLMSGVLALACTLSACATAPAKPSPDQLAAARLSAETGYDASLVGVEQSLKSGALTGSAIRDARISLLASYAVLVAGRASFAGSGATPSSALQAAASQVDSDYARVIAELPPA